MFHNRLITKFSKYKVWHSYAYHNHFHWLIVFLIALISCSSLLIVWKTDSDLDFGLKQGIVMGESTGFESRRQAYINSNGSHFNYLWDGNEPDAGAHAAIWAWLENSKTIDEDSNVNGPGTPIYKVIDEWMYNRWTDFGWHVHILHSLRALYQYGDKINPGQREELQTLLDRTVLGEYGFYFFELGSLNNRLFDMVVRFLMSEGNPGVDVKYGSGSEDYNERLDTFIYEGETYTPGKVYKSLAVSRDWLYWKFDELTKTGVGDEELDADYTKTFIDSLYTLYDFALDPEMKKRAKMVLDIILLDSILDTSAELHGGHVGRTSFSQIICGRPWIYEWPYWGIGSDPSGSEGGFFYDVYVSTYRPPGLIYDIGRLDDEPDNYWHINTENNGTWGIGGTGKWNYVTPYYNLGGSPTHWMFNMNEGIRVWVDGVVDVVGKCEHGECYTTIGTGGYQYKNAMLIKSYNKLHVIDTDGCDVYNIINDDPEETDFIPSSVVGYEQHGNWHFLYKGRVAVAIQLGVQDSALEVAVIGVDYSDVNGFIGAVTGSAGIVPSSNPVEFKTSKGDIITTKFDNTKKIEMTYANGELVWDYPLDRLETFVNPEMEDVEDNFYEGEDEDGDEKYYLTYWDKEDKTLIVKHGELSCKYDFTEWDYEDLEGDACEGEEVEGIFKESCTDWNSAAVCCESGYGCNGTSNYRTTDCNYPQRCCVGECYELPKCYEVCSEWSNNGCGASSCSLTMMGQSRSCTEPTCSEQRCLSDESCNTPDAPDDPPFLTCDFDGVCEPGENSINCGDDCPDTSPVCDNDGICEIGESNSSCPNDCPLLLSGQLAPDFNCDNRINIQDFAILLTRWGKTDNLDNYSHDQCNNPVNLNIVTAKNNEQEIIDISDFGRLLSCWGTPQDGSCYE